MIGRDAQGRFVNGNGYASLGGQARAVRLPASRRREIAAAGWAAFVEKRFGGNDAWAREWLGRLGAWASDAPYRDGFAKFAHPGPCPVASYRR